MNLFIPILIIGNVFNNPNWVPGVNKQPAIGVQAQNINCLISFVTNQNECCASCYGLVSGGLLSSCCSGYTTCILTSATDCKVKYFDCTKECKKTYKLSCDDDAYSSECPAFKI